MSKKESKRKKQVKASEKDEDEFSIDFKRVVTLFSKHQNKLIPAALILIALFLGVWLRMQTASLPVTDSMARDGVINIIRNDMATVLYAEKPELTSAEHEMVLNQLLEEVLGQQTYTFMTGEFRGQAFDIEELTDVESQTFKNFFKDSTGTTYFLHFDSWTHFRKVRNKVETGQFHDETKQGEPWNQIRFYEEPADTREYISWDSHIFAPIGYKMWIDLHLYVGYYFFKIASLFFRNISLETALFVLPALIAALAVIPAFFITRKIAGNLGGFIAAVIVAVHPYFLSRTLAGVFDTDAYVMTLPLFIAWLFLEAFETESLKSTIILATSAGFLMGVTSFTWTLWWYIFNFLFATVGLFILFEIGRAVLSKTKLKPNEIVQRLKLPACLTAVFLMSSLLFISLFSGTAEVQKFYVAPLEFALGTGIRTATIWPNIYSSVKELSTNSLSEVISKVSLNHSLFFYLSIIGILLTLTRLKNERIDVKYALFLIIWFTGTSFASLKGVRFIMIVVPAFSIALGVFAGRTYQLVTPMIVKRIPFDRRITQCIFAILLLLLLVIPINSGREVAKTGIPYINDDWNSALTRIRMESEQDAIITSWWDFGHPFKAIADRGVTFDGSSQNTPVAPWVGRMLLTENEQEAVEILRKLDCGLHWVHILLKNSLYDSIESANALNDILLLDQEDARIRLEVLVTPEEAENMLQYIFCEPPEAYVITSEDMIKKAEAWSHFGSWDLERAEMYAKVKGKSSRQGTTILVEEFGLSEKEAARYHYEIQDESADDWISPWQQYWITGSCSTKGDITVCQSPELNFLIDRTTGESAIQTPFGIQKFYSVAFIDSNHDFRIVKADDNLLENEGLKFGVAVYGFPEPNKFIITAASTEGAQQGNELLPGSMFSRLYFFQGHDLEHFDLFDSRTTNAPILTWKVDWDGGLKSNVRMGNILWMNYIGWLEDETVFDSTIVGWINLTIPRDMADFEEFEAEPIPYIQGSGTLLSDLEETLEGMKEGEVKDVVILPEQAYGTDLALHPLANQTLYFRIEVVKIA